MSKISRRIRKRILISFLLAISGLVTSAFAQQQTPLFTPGNLVVSVEGNGVEGGSGAYTDNQAAPFTLFQFELNPSSPRR
jgi:hypothetical protein